MLQHHPESTYFGVSTIELNQRAKRRAGLMMAGVALLAATPHVNAYSFDVQRNIEIQQSATIDIDRLYEPLNQENRNTAIIAIDGFGSYDARTLAKYLGPVAQQFIDGQIWSVRYGNAPLETDKIVDKIVELSQAYGVDRIGILGYSAGGIIGTKVTVSLLENTALDVPLILKVSTPDGMEGLRDVQLQEIEVAKIIESIPGATHSTAVRYLGEMYFRRDRFDEGSPLARAQDFLHTHNWVMDDLQKDTLPGTWLLIDQVNVIAQSDLQQTYNALGNLPEAKKPTIVYLGTDRPGYDYVVNDALSGDNICGYARTNGMTCLIDAVPGAVHTRPDLANDAYIETAQRLAPVVQYALEQGDDNGDKP